jgi:hypothetical protein
MSGKNRQAATDFILKNIEALLPGNSDTPRYKAYLEGLNDKAFEAYMADLKSGAKFLTITAPNFAKSTLSLERNYALADRLKLSFHHKLWFEGDGDTPTFLSPIEYMVVKLPLRLASQRLAKKMSIPKTQRVVNTLTGQPTGDSKGASISYPELRVCAAMGLDNTMIELMKYRGGDVRGGMALNASLMRTGRANIETLSHFASGVESTNTLKTFLTSAHLKNTL